MRKRDHHVRARRTDPNHSLQQHFVFEKDEQFSRVTAELQRRAQPCQSEKIGRIPLGLMLHPLNE
jgi:hypothetical protein